MGSRLTDDEMKTLARLVREYGRSEVEDTIDQLCTHDPPTPMTAEADHWPRYRWESCPRSFDGFHIFALGESKCGVCGSTR